MEEEREVECETTVSYSWSQLIEPRLIYPWLESEQVEDALKKGFILFSYLSLLRNK